MTPGLASLEAAALIEAAALTQAAALAEPVGPGVPAWSYALVAVVAVLLLAAVGRGPRRRR